MKKRKLRKQRSVGGECEKKFSVTFHIPVINTPSTEQGEGVGQDL